MSLARLGSSTPLRVGLAMTAALCVAAAPASRAPPPLQPLTQTDLRQAALHSTGCYWYGSGGGSVRLVMADDRAAAKIAGKLVVLSPDVGAGDLFPFTFDRWRAHNIAIEVVASGPARRLGSEAVRQAETVAVTIKGTKRLLRGKMICGS